MPRSTTVGSGTSRSPATAAFPVVAVFAVIAAEIVTDVRHAARKRPAGGGRGTRHCEPGHGSER